MRDRQRDGRTDNLLQFHSKRALLWRYKMYVGLHVKCQIFFSRFYLKFGVSRQIFVKISGIKFHEDPSSGSRAHNAAGMTRGQTLGRPRAGGQT